MNTFSRSGLLHNLVYVSYLTYVTSFCINFKINFSQSLQYCKKGALHKVTIDSLTRLLYLTRVE